MNLKRRRRPGIFYPADRHPKPFLRWTRLDRRGNTDLRLKQLAKRIMPPLIIDALRKNPEVSVEGYTQNGRIPWSPGYRLAKNKTITDSLSDRTLMHAFRDHLPLPDKYGYAIDERAVEYPWVFAGMTDEPQAVLDAGSALNHDYAVDYLVHRNKTLHIVTLAPEPQSFWQQGVSHLYCDLRALPYRDEFFDLIVSISTLEHVGFDNSPFTHSSQHKEHSPTDFRIVMAEFNRTLKRGGTLMFTVPFGVWSDYVTFQQFDLALLEDALHAFGPATAVATTFFKYTINGWRFSTPGECRECEYVAWLPEAMAKDLWPTKIPAEEDLAAAARAVACVKMVK